MNEKLKQISRENNAKELGGVRKMLVNEVLEDGTLVGYTESMKQIVATSGDCPMDENVKVGEIIPVRITGAGEFKLQGEIM
jgi:tRNA A37 methylthiotransferase MiaB